MEQERMQLSEPDINEAIGKLRRTGKYEEDVLRLVKDDYLYGLSKDEIDVYLERRLTMEVRKSISVALREGCGIALAKLFVDAGLNEHQIVIAMDFFKDGAPYEIIKAVIEQKINAYGMREAYQEIMRKSEEIKNVSEKETANVDKVYVKSMLEEMKQIVSEIRFDEKRFDALNEKLKEISYSKNCKNEIDELYRRLEDKDLLINSQQDNIQQANAALARSRKELDIKEDEIKQLKESVSSLKNQLAEKNQVIEVSGKKARGQRQEEYKIGENRIPVRYSLAFMGAGKQKANFSMLERADKKSTGAIGLLGNLVSKKKSRQDIVKLVASGNLKPEQLVQIRIAIEKHLTEDQLLNLINNNVPAEQMKEIIEIAVLENSIQQEGL